MRTASSESTSTCTSRFLASPITSRVSPGAHLALAPPLHGQHAPGDRRAEHALHGAQRRCRSVRRSAASAAASSAAARVRLARRLLERLARGRAVRGQAGHAVALRGGAACAVAWAAFTRSAASVRARGSRIGERGGSSQSERLALRTASPSSSVIRRRKPLTGAVIS